MPICRAARSRGPSTDRGNGRAHDALRIDAGDDVGIHARAASILPRQIPAFYALETRNWKSAASLEPVPTKDPETQFVTYWARVVAHGHLHEAELARADLAAYESLLERVKQGKHAYVAEGVGRGFGAAR